MATEKTSRLVVEADTSQLKQSKSDLDSFSTSAEKTGQATEKFNAKAKVMGDVLGTTAKKTEQAGDAMAELYKDTLPLSSVFGKVADPVDRLGKKLNEQSKYYKNLTITQGQYTNAVRMLPAQFTDIAVQMEMGTNPFTILLQQGGQIKDQFGGISNTFKSFAATINPASVALGGLVVAFAGLAKAGYDSSKAFDDMASSVIFAGGSGFRSVQEMAEAATRVAEKTGATVGNVREKLVEFNDTGRYTAAQMILMAEAAEKYEQAGKDASDMTADFAKIVADPVSGLADLDKQYGFVTASQMKHIIALEKEGKQAQATDEAVRLFGQTMIERSDKVIEATDNVGQAWLGLKKTGSEVWDGLGVAARAWGNALVDVGKSVKNALQVVIADFLAFDAQLTQAMLGGLNDILTKIPGGEKLSDAMGLKDGLAGAKADIDRYHKESLEANKRFAEAWKRSNRGIGSYEDDVRNQSVSGSGTSDKEQAEVAKLAAEAKKQTKEKQVQVSLGDRLAEQYQAQTLAIQAQIEVMKNRNAFDQNASTQQRNYLELQAKINILEGIQADAKGRALTKQEESLLAQKDEVLEAARQAGKQGDVLQAMQKQAQIHDDITRSMNDNTATIEAIRAGWGKSADEAARLLENARRAAALKDKGATPDDIEKDRKSREALEKAQQGYGESVTDKMSSGAKTALEQFSKQATDYTNLTKQAVTAGLDTMVDGLTNFVMTGKLGFKDLLKSFLAMVVQMTIKWLAFKAIQGIASSFSGGGAAVVANAKGGAYQSADLSAFSGQIVSKPTLFNFDAVPKFAKGAGLMGEAGAEAIMPLKRGADGSLGVRAIGGGGGGDTIQIGVNVTVQDGNASVTSRDGSNDQLGKAYADAITEGANQAIEQGLRPGGRIFVAKATR